MFCFVAQHLLKWLIRLYDARNLSICIEVNEHPSVSLGHPFGGVESRPAFLFFHSTWDICLSVPSLLLNLHKRPLSLVNRMLNVLNLRLSLFSSFGLLLERLSLLLERLCLLLERLHLVQHRLGLLLDGLMLLLGRLRLMLSLLSSCGLQMMHRAVAMASLSILGGKIRMPEVQWWLPISRSMPVFDRLCALMLLSLGPDGSAFTGYSCCIS